MSRRKYFGAEVKTDLQLVYAIWIGDFVYVGSGFPERLNGNVNKVKRGVHSNHTLQQAYNDGEIKEIKTELLDFNLDSADEARHIEQEYIEYFAKVDGVILCNARKSDNGCTSETYNKHERLTEDKVREIKQLLDDCNNKELAETYKCSENTISKIRNGYRWANVAI